VKIVKRNNIQAGMVAHAYNSSYSRDRDLEDHGSRSAWAKTGDPIPKLMKAKIAGVMTQVEHPPNKQEVKFKPHTTKTNKKRNKILQKSQETRLYLHVMGPMRHLI
jgi:hypothetical protein